MGNARRLAGTRIFFETSFFQHDFGAIVVLDRALQPICRQAITFRAYPKTPALLNVK